jgi:looped-hinge helix DNA binding domain, AbrB family
MGDKGVCTKGRIVYGVVTVSKKGQIAIPVDVRRDLEIRSGDKLMVLKRRDGAGITLIKLRAMDELIFKIQEDEDLFSKIEEDRRR